MTKSKKYPPGVSQIVGATVIAIGIGYSLRLVSTIRRKIRRAVEQLKQLERLTRSW